MSDFDTQADLARAARQDAMQSAEDAIESLVPPEGPGAGLFWREVRDLAGQRVWPEIERVRKEDPGLTWAFLANVMGTTAESLRNAFSRWISDRSV